jgi:hypothetical protein
MSYLAEGDPSSNIVILHQAPGKNEIREGKVITGNPGGVLDTCLHEAGLIRRECYLLSLWEDPIRVTKDGAIFHAKDGILLWSTNKGFTTPGLRLAANCIKRLKKCEANVAVPLGAACMDLLTDKADILKWRGSPLIGIEPEGLTIIPTIDPAKTLKGKFLWRYGIIADFDKARKHRKSKERLTLKRNIILAPTLKQTLAFLKKIKKIASVDIECYNNAVSCIAFAPDSMNAICIPFFMGNEHYWSATDEVKIWSEIARIMGDPTIDKLGQNLVFDMGFLFDRNNIITRGRIWDCMIAWSIMYPELADKKNGFGKGLPITTSFFTNEPYYKDDGKMWDKIKDDPETFWLYNARDSLVCIDMWPILFKELESYMPTYELVEEILPILIHMMHVGVKVNKDALIETRRTVRLNIDTKLVELKEIAGFELNPLSPKQCCQYFYGIKGVAPYTNYKTGKPTCDDKALQRIYRKTHLREAKLCQEIRGLNKQISYLDFDFDDDGRLRCSYNPQGTKFGRLSSSKTIRGTGLNMLNLTPAFKVFMEPG